MLEKEATELEASMPTQEDRDKVREEEDDSEADKKADHVKQERDFVDNILKLQSGYAIQPIGRDRLYRRYWLFNTVHGLFVEDDDDEFVPAVALNPCTQNPGGSCFDINNPMAGPPKLMSSQVNQAKPAEVVPTPPANESRDGSDKENDSMNTSNLNNSELGDANTTVNAQSTNNSLAVQEKSNTENVGNTDTPENGIKRTGSAIVISDDDDSKQGSMKSLELMEVETPAVKQIKEWSKHKWSFFTAQEDVEALICGLNSRGFRENGLKHALVENKFHIIDTVVKVPKDFLHIPDLNDDDDGKDKADGKPKTTEWKTRGKSVTYTKQNDSAHEGLELNLRELILDLEERIHVGSLGHLRVSFGILALFVCYLALFVCYTS